jgi:hypothetical protein
MPDTPKQTLYIFIDESGNFDFSPNGTKYFVLTAVSTLSPLKSREDFLKGVYELKYQGWNNGQSDYYFHATEDKQETRDWVFAKIKDLDDIQVDAIVAQKNKANPSLYIQYEVQPDAKDFLKFKTVRSEEKFYDKISQMLLQYVCNRHHDKDGVEKIVVVLGSIFTEKKRGYVLKSLKQYLKNKFKKPFYVYFHDTASDINCQLADYCGWAIYVAAERGEKRPFQEIKSKVASCFYVFERGTNEYYEYKK